MNRPTTLYFPFTAQGTPTGLVVQGVPAFLCSRKPSSHPQTFVVQRRSAAGDPSALGNQPPPREEVVQASGFRRAIKLPGSLMMAASKSSSIPTWLSSSGLQLTAVDPQADLVDVLTRLVNLWPAARMNEPMAPGGGGRSRGQETRSLRACGRLQSRQLFAVRRRHPEPIKDWSLDEPEGEADRRSARRSSTTAATSHSRWPRSLSPRKCSRRFCGSSRNSGRSLRPRRHEVFDGHALKSNRQEGMRPDASENSQISSSTIVRACPSCW